MNKPIIASPQVTNHILHRFKLRADKKLGQNFLIEPALADRIVAAAALTPDDIVLEIGPGYGAATALLAERVAHLTCVEIDGALASDLAARFAGRDVVVRHADATALEDAAGTYDTARNRFLFAYDACTTAGYSCTPRIPRIGITPR